MEPIKVGFLVSYDHELLKQSLPIVYEAADSITLAVDENKATWTGSPIEIDDSFFEWVNKFDTKKKIRIYRDNFYVPEMSTKQNETRERNMLSEFMGHGGWHLQIDADEYFVDFAKFCEYLRAQDINKKINVRPLFIPLFKKLDTGYLFVTGMKERIPVATNYPHYTMCRANKVEIVDTEHLVIHDSWARSEEELLMKLTNWGHNTDFHVLAYFELWKAVNEHNYMYMHDFHPMVKGLWEGLEYVEGNNAAEISQKLADHLSNKKHKSKIEFAAEQPIFQILIEKIRKKLRKPISQ